MYDPQGLPGDVRRGPPGKLDRTVAIRSTTSIPRVPTGTFCHSLKVRIGICNISVPVGFFVWLSPRSKSLRFSARSNRSMVAGLMRSSLARTSGVSAILRLLRAFQPS